MSTPGTSNRTGSLDASSTWENLSNGLDVIYRRDNMDKAYYMHLYTSVYQYCTSITLANGGSGSTIRREVRQNHRGQGAAEFVGHEMYRRVKEYVVKHVDNIQQNGADLSGEDLLKFFTREWYNFRFSSRVMNGIFAYLNRHWIRRELDEGHDDVYVIYTLALMIWKDHMLEKMREKIIDAVLELIRRERCGEIINKGYISGVVGCLVELGIDEYEATENAFPRKSKDKDKLIVYREFFEKKFLQATKDFYQKEASDFLMNGGTVVDYMIKVEKRLEEEDSRCLMYLNENTKNSLATCCEEVLIATQLHFFQSAFGGLLEAGKDEDLARMFKLCDRVANGLDNLRGALESHIAKEGHEALEKIANEAFNDARLYTTCLLDVHQRYQKLVQNSFGSDPGFMQALDKAATQFINHNAVTKKAPPSQTNSKSAELLAKYSDQLLRKTSKMPDETELESLLNKIMIVFKYIDDKDVFSKFYTKMFSKRLINEISASEDAETNFITKLKNMCGYEYTARLSKMVNDTQVSKDLCADFKEKLANKNNVLGLEFNVLVLSSGSWPSFQATTMILPKKLNMCLNTFVEYYNEKFNGRRLSWIYSQSRGEIVAQCFPRKYVFTATTAQMATILLFNDQDTYTVKQIMQATGLDLKSLTPSLASLIKYDLFKLEKDAGEELTPETIININNSYSNKKVRVDLSKMAVRQEAHRENDTVHKNVEEDRKGIISAAIVRIMKTRKRVQHVELMNEVLQQLAPRFKPKVEMIKRCIGSLIEKEYMMRAEGQKDLYEYIA